MSSERISAIITSSSNLVSFEEIKGAPGTNAKGEPTEGKMQLVFKLQGHLVPVKTASGNVMSPCAINRKSVSPIIQSCLDNTMTDEGEALETSEAILKVSGVNLIKWSDKRITRFSEWLNQRAEFENPQERFLAAKTILSKMAKIMSENDKTVGVSDPDSTVKGIFAKCGTFAALLAEEINPQELVKKAIEKQIQDLNNLLTRSQEISKEDYITFLKTKEAACGQDEDGNVRLKKPSEKKAATTPEVSQGEGEDQEEEVSTEGTTED